jgi:hypothetical protein
LTGPERQNVGRRAAFAGNAARLALRRVFVEVGFREKDDHFVDVG